MTESSTPALTDAPGTPENTEADDTVPVEVLRALRRHLPFAMEHVRRSLSALGPGQWAILSELLSGWARHDDPANQAELSTATGYCVRAVRNVLQELEEAGVVAVTRCGKSVVYEMGATLVLVLVDFAWGLDRSVWVRGARLPCEDIAAPGAATERLAPLNAAPRADVGLRTPAPDAAEPITSAAAAAMPQRSSAPPAGETHSGIPTPARNAAMVSRTSAPGAAFTVAGNRGPLSLGALVATNLQRVRVFPADAPDCSESTPAPGADVPASRTPLLIKEEELISFSSFSEGGPADVGAAVRASPPSTHDHATLRAIACRALMARHRAGFPDRAPPATFPIEHVDLVMAVTANETSSVADLDQLHLDAIAGASPKSKKQPPAVTFIWGNRDYFLQNARDGRTKREAAMRPAKLRPKPKEPDEPPATLAELEEIGRRGQALLSGPAPHETTRPRNTRFFP